MDYKVFISHTRRDNDLAKDLARRLEEAGATVFSVEKSALSGESVITSVNRGLRDADEVIIILTEGSVNSPGVISQTGAAFSLRKRVTPLVVGVEDNELPPFISKYVRYPDLHKYIASLARRTKTLRPQVA